MDKTLGRNPEGRMVGAEREGLSRAEPAPIANTSRPIWELVVEDMETRDNEGRKKYGTPLQAFNGRNCLIDDQESLDLVVYLRQKIEEEKQQAPYEEALDKLRLVVHHLVKSAPEQEHDTAWMRALREADAACRKAAR